MDKTAFQWGIEPLRKYATFSGRAPRSEYWYYYLLTIFANMLGSVVDFVSGVPVLGAVLAVALLLPSLAVYVRRLHDLDRRGWWLFAPLAGLFPIAIGLATGGTALFSKSGPSGSGLIWTGIGALTFFGGGVLLFVWFCTRGTEGANRFGDDPLNPTDDFVEVFS